ncbi:hypothetical protein AAFC00_004923 [Neodothiora populina]|uniref:3,4-dihydroxy-2-butanone 4-phosphate synthase n=1 Tax=Neodothiora populina TaxID=2781224 RepID=A0ABR3P3T2_9PEZI
MADSTLQFDAIRDAIAAFARGDFLIVLDSPLRENEGDLIISAAHLTPSKASFLIHHSSGYLCAALPSRLADALDLPPMVPASANQDKNRTAYTVTVDAAEGVTTGISATDRALTCRLLGDKSSSAATFRRPGHVVPLRAVEGGVRARQGHTEAAVEFSRLAGLEPAVGIIAEVVETPTDVEGKGGEMTGEHMMRGPALVQFGRKYGILVVTIEDLKKYVEEKEGKL